MKINHIKIKKKVDLGCNKKHKLEVICNRIILAKMVIIKL